jgi:hypothetical protein
MPFTYAVCVEDQAALISQRKYSSALNEAGTSWAELGAGRAVVRFERANKRTSVGKHLEVIRNMIADQQITGIRNVQKPDGSDQDVCIQTNRVDWDKHIRKVLV